MPHSAEVHLVHDPDDSLALATRIAALTDLSQGRAVCHPTPGVQRPDDFAADLLVALGKRFDALRFERARKKAWHLTEVWFEAERIRHLFVLRSHLLHRDLWARLVDLSRRCGTEIWFSVSQPTQHPGPPDAQTGQWSQTRFLSHWQDTAGNDHQSWAAGVNFPEVPTDDFLTFRATCRRLLTDDDFARVDTMYCASMDQTDAWLRPGGPHSWPIRDLSEHGVAEAQIRDLLSRVACNSEAVVRIRGAQAAYFRVGWLLDFSPDFVHPRSGLAPLGPNLSPALATRLRRLCTPAHTAAMALSLAADLGSEGLALLNVEHIDQDGGGVSLDDDHRLAIPGYAQGLVRAQLIQRARDGATGRDPLFVSPDTRQRYEGHVLRTVLRRVSYRTALAIGDHDSNTSATTAGIWAADRGIRLLRLDLDPALFP